MKKFTLSRVLDGFRSTSSSSSSAGDQGGGPAGSRGSGQDGGSGGGGDVGEKEDKFRAEWLRVGRTFRQGFPHVPSAIAYDPIQRLLAIGTKAGFLRILGSPGVEITFTAPATSTAPPAGPSSRGTRQVSGTPPQQQQQQQQPTAQAQPASPTTSSGPPPGFVQLEFVINEGLMLALTADDTIHLLTFKGGLNEADTKGAGTVEVVHSLKFLRERLTCLQSPLPPGSRHIYVGTDRGNSYLIHLDTFAISPNNVPWNKAIEVSRKTHPGPVIQLSECPIDPSKLLIGFESGQIVLWDMKLKAAEGRWIAPDVLRSLCWKWDGSSFMGSHGDGSLTTWVVSRGGGPPSGVVVPHARKETSGISYKPIPKVQWKSGRNGSGGDPFVIFSGGVVGAGGGGFVQELTIIQGKTTTVLEMEHPVIDFIVITEGVWEWDPSDSSPRSILVLLQSDLVVIDLLTPGFPCIPNPYAMDIHESPVTCLEYFVDAPGDLIPALYSAGSRSKVKGAGTSGGPSTASASSTGVSERDWPVDGGVWAGGSCSYAEVLVVGHLDGTLHFYDASSSSLQILYKLKTAKPFERPHRSHSNQQQQARPSTTPSEDPFAVTMFKFDLESKLLAVAGASSQVLLYKWKKGDTSSIGDPAVLEIPIVPDETLALMEDFGGFDFVGGGSGGGKKDLETFVPLRVRPGGGLKPGSGGRSGGFMIEMICLTPWVNGEPPGGITGLGVVEGGSGCSWLAYGNDSGLVIVDITTRSLYATLRMSEVYGGGPGGGDMRGPLRSPNAYTGGGGGYLTTPPTGGNTATSPMDPSNRSPQQQDLQQQQQSQDATTSSTTTQQQRSPRHQKGQFVERRSRSQGMTPPPSSTTTSSASQPQLMKQFSVVGVGGGGGHHHHHQYLHSNHGDHLQGVNKLLMMRGYCSIGGSGGGGGSGSGGGEKFDPTPPTTSSFSRSRSSSASSLENNNFNDGVTWVGWQPIGQQQSLEDSPPPPPLLVGTSSGTLLSHPLQAGATPTHLLKLRGAIVQATSFGNNLLVVVSERQVGVVNLYPSNEQNKRPPPPLMMTGLPEAVFFVKSGLSCLGRDDTPILMTYASDGTLRLYTLPSLRVVMEIEGWLRIETDLSFHRTTTAPSCSTASSFASSSIVTSSSSSSATTAASTKERVLLDPMLASGWGQRVLVNEDLDNISKTLTFSSSHGHGLYLCSPSEIQKFTVDAEFLTTLPTLLPTPFKRDLDLPERPKESFLAGLFGVGGLVGGPAAAKVVDREELFNEPSLSSTTTSSSSPSTTSSTTQPSSRAANATRSVARYVAGTKAPPIVVAEQSAAAAFERAGSGQGGVGGASGGGAGGGGAGGATGGMSDVSRARMLMVERGQRLGELGDRTERMANESESFSSAAHQLMLKYKDKKWYQL